MRLENNFSADGLQLKQMIKQTIFARSLSDDSKIVFSGVLLEKAGDTIRMVCTDTHRLTYVFLPLRGEGSDFKGIIPGKTMTEVQRLIEDDPVDVFFDQSKMIFKFRNIEIMTRLIDGQYPNYENIIPSTCGTKLKIDARSLEEVMERAYLISRDDSMKVAAARFQVADGTLNVEQSNETGRVFEKIAVEQEGEDLQISFNIRYILDTIKAINTEFLIMEANGSFNAVIFRPENADNYISLILPMRF
jgi:DNA polymerase-3 subunit beta